jgi:hypothetical protein
MRHFYLLALPRLAAASAVPAQAPMQCHTGGRFGEAWGARLRRGLNARHGGTTGPVAFTRAGQL